MGDFKPNFICIGPERSGTTWLYQCLKEQPDICMSEPKELNFFNSSQAFWRKDLLGSSKYHPSLQGYAEHFSHCIGKTIFGEVTPAYIHSPEVPERLQHHFPDVKLIALLRNPTERLFSHYMYTKLKGVYQLPSFEEVIEKEKEFVAEGNYAMHLKNYLKLFKPEQILILFYDDIEKEPENLYKKVCSFIGADESFSPPSLRSTINSAGATLVRKRILKVRNILKQIPGGRLLISLFKKTPLHKKVLKSADTRSGTAQAKYGEMLPETRKKLIDFYRSDILELQQMTGRDLSKWLS